MLTFKRIAGPGAPRFAVFAGARPLGTISNPGPGADGGSWQGLAPDGTRFAATSKPRIAGQLQAHARSPSGISPRSTPMGDPRPISPAASPRRPGIDHRDGGGDDA